MNKKTIGILLASAALFAACGDDESAVTEAPESVEAPPGATGAGVDGTDAEDEAAESSIPASDPTASAPDVAAPPLEIPDRGTVSVGIAGGFGPYLPVIAAREKGYLAEEGLEIDIQELRGSPSIAAVLAGDLDYATSASSSLNAIFEGAPLRVVWNTLSSPNYEIWSIDPDITTLADLPGHSLGVLTARDSLEQSARLIMTDQGIDPDGVAFTPVNEPPLLAAAVQSGSVDAAVLLPSQVAELEGSLGVKLGDTSEIEMPAVGLVTKIGTIEDDPEKSLAFMRAMVKSTLFVQECREASAAILSAYAGETVEFGLAEWDDYVPEHFTADGQLSEQNRTEHLELVVVLNDVGGEVPALDQVYDYTPAELAWSEVAESGFEPDCTP